MIVNLQRKIPLNTREYRSFVETLHGLFKETEEREFSVAFVSDRRMKELNSFFRGKTSTTDVLSFPHETDEFDSVVRPDAKASDGEIQNRDYLGDIVISVEQAQKQAGENGLTLENEVKQLILHGLLHLCGYDHETDDGEMNKRELELRRKLKI